MSSPIGSISDMCRKRPADSVDDRSAGNSPKTANTKTKRLRSVVEGGDLCATGDNDSKKGNAKKMPESDINLDIIRKIASFVDATVGPELMNLLIAVGPADARKIRRDYLRNNDVYLAKSLSLCMGAMAPALHMFTANSSTIMNMYLLSIKYFNKCRDNVLAWMDVNPGWKSRCTTANLKRYRQRLLPEANLIFNNPVVAIEIGLQDVYSHLVNEKHVDVCDTNCRGITTVVALSHQGMNNYIFNQVIVALYRGDTEILQTLLSSNTFRTTRAAAPSNSRILNDWDILNYCYDSEQSKIRSDVFKTLVLSPKIDVNVTRNDFSCLYDLSQS